MVHWVHVQETIRTLPLDKLSCSLPADCTCDGYLSCRSPIAIESSKTWVGGQDILKHQSFIGAGGDPTKQPPSRARTEGFERKKKRMSRMAHAALDSIDKQMHSFVAEAV